MAMTPLRMLLMTWRKNRSSRSDARLPSERTPVGLELERRRPAGAALRGGMSAKVVGTELSAARQGKGYALEFSPKTAVKSVAYDESVGADYNRIEIGLQNG
jgi:hypothetical protein